MRLRATAATVAVLAFGGLAACGHDKPGPAPTTVTPTRPPTSPAPTRTATPPETPTCGWLNPNCVTVPPTADTTGVATPGSDGGTSGGGG